MIIGDKGRGSTKCCIVPLYWNKRGSPRALIPLAILDGDDSYENIDGCCSGIIEAQNNSKSLTEETISLFARRTTMLEHHVMNVASSAATKKVVQNRWVV